MKVIFNESCFFKQISIFTFNSGIPLHLTVVPQRTTGTTGKNQMFFLIETIRAIFVEKRVFSEG